MKHAFLFAVLALLQAVTQVRADVPAVDFYIVEAKMLLPLLQSKSLDSLDDVVLRQASKVSGQVIAGNGNFRIRMGALQFYSRSVDWTMSPEAKSGTATIPYDFVLTEISDREEHKFVEISGQAKLEGGQFINPGWKHEPYAVIFRRQNLKK